MPAHSSASLALGVDIGGTFTDIVLAGGGRVHIGKVLTDGTDLARGVLDGVRAVLERDGLEAARVARGVHGTTLATNTLIERRGARTALIVTRGFRDVLELARGNRYDIFDLDIEMPRPLVPRADVFEVDERVDAHGATLAAPDPRALDCLAREIRTRGFEAVAVCLLHAYLDASHERQVAEAIARVAPEIAVSVSADVMPDIGEYERASTTVANAYIRPIVRGYLDRLRRDLRGLGVAIEPLIMTSDGGTVACDTAVEHPVRLVESGPAGGAVAAAHCSAQGGFGDVIAFDMGGTTAKICVIDDGRPERATEFEVARVYRFARGSGLPLRVPVTEMIEIGAGGGSIARVDETGLLKVGPDSAGSDPGPACYMRGGAEPTVTDADLVLGYLDPEFFLGGAMRLERERALDAIASRVAGPLRLDPLRAAAGIHDIVNNNMARAAKVHCFERGKDPRTYSLVAFGGAGSGARMAARRGARDRPGDLPGARRGDVGVRVPGRGPLLRAGPGASRATGGRGLRADQHSPSRIEFGIPTWARFVTPVSSAKRWRTTRIDEPIVMRGQTHGQVAVEPGDPIVAGADGVIVVPSRVAETVAEAAEELDRIEQRQREEILRGDDRQAVYERYDRFGHIPKLG